MDSFFFLIQQIICCCTDLHNVRTCSEYVTSVNAVQWILSHNNVLHVSNQSSLQLVDGQWKMEDAVIVICDGDISWLSDFILNLLPSSVALNSL